MDDIIVCAPDYETLLKRSDRLFSHIIAVGIKLNLSKCKTGQKQVNFVGHVVSKEGYQPDPANIEAVSKMKPPTNEKKQNKKT